MTTTNPQAALITVADACTRLHLSRPTVYLLINTGQLRSFKVGKARRIPVGAIDEYIDNMLAGTESGPGAA
jgi:excisionase family DNA binding protein